MIGIKCSERNGPLVGAIALDASHDVMLISDKGTLVRTRAAEIAYVGRNTQGVTLIRVDVAETLVAVVGVETEAEDPLVGDSRGRTAAAGRGSAVRELRPELRLAVARFLLTAPQALARPQDSSQRRPGRTGGAVPAQRGPCPRPGAAARGLDPGGA